MKKIILAALLLAPMTMFAQKFGHFNSQTLMQEMPEVKALQTRNNANRTQKQIHCLYDPKGLFATRSAAAPRAGNH